MRNLAGPPAKFSSSVPEIVRRAGIVNHRTDQHAGVWHSAIDKMCQKLRIEDNIVVDREDEIRTPADGIAYADVASHGPPQVSFRSKHAYGWKFALNRISRTIGATIVDDNDLKIRITLHPQNFAGIAA